MLLLLKLLAFSLEFSKLLLKLVQLLLFSLQLLLRDKHFLLSLCECLALWSDLLVDFVELADGDDPFAETLGGLRCVSYDLWPELGIVQIRLNLCHNGSLDILLWIAL